MSDTALFNGRKAGGYQNTALAFRTYGDPGRPPLLLLHGFLGDASEWQPWLSRLSVHWFCLLVDLPGHGHSVDSALSHSTGFKPLSGQLARLMSGLSDQRWAIWGYSLGGRIALYSALREHLPLRWLLCESMHPGLDSYSLRAARRQHDERWAQQFEQDALADVLERWYRQPVFADLTEQARIKLIELRLENNSQALAKMLRATSLGRQPRLSGGLSQLPFPWLYLAGAKDVKFARLAQKFPRGQHQVIADAGHNIHRERPQALWSSLQMFLSRAGLIKELQ